jgi:hypothetical protein
VAVADKLDETTIAKNLMSQCGMWHIGIGLEAQRTIQASGPGNAVVRSLSARFFVIALRGLIATATAVHKRWPDPKLEGSLSRFNHRVPNAKLVRDIIEHGEAYAAGEGCKQSSSGGRALVFFTVGTGDDVEIRVNQLSLSVVDAREWADRVAAEVDRVLGSVSIL